MSIRSQVKNWDYSFNVPIGGNQILFDFQVPARCSLVMRDFGNTCGTLLAWGVVYWSFLLDGFPMYPYGQVFDQLGFQTGRQFIEEIEVEGGHRIQVIAYNPTAGIVRLGMSGTYELRFLNQPA